MLDAFTMGHLFEKFCKIRPIIVEGWNLRAYWGVYFRTLQKIAQSKKLRAQALLNSKLKLLLRHQKQTFKILLPLAPVLALMYSAKKKKMKAPGGHASEWTYRTRSQTFRVYHLKNGVDIYNFV